MDEKQKGLPITLDVNAESASPDLPAFLARPKGAPVYHGFLLLEDVSADGFTFGTITDFESEETNCGDAFVVAPDNTRAGLVWEIAAKPFFEEIVEPTDERWGVYEVGFSGPMRTREDARRNLRAILPKLKDCWERWLKARSSDCG